MLMITIPANASMFLKIFSQVTYFEITTTFIDWTKQKVIVFDFEAEE